MTTVVAEVRGGVLVDMHSTDPIQYIRVDWDQEGDDRVGLYYPDNITDDPPSLFENAGKEEVQAEIKKLLNDRTGI
jgi:hypothetical protein